ncbi:MULTISPECIES: T6SS immunity protein Tdi1 domain-containing protein [unclassified Mesorhizobium]|uniref:T6SS immunity protein Tdi1 domain-containing protein n=2 Tax=Mesorhizobium TaxID=68287 RepID=UPI000BAE6B94|nr:MULTISPECIES: T6SS immunity protein Tdi1 domain-containing protein [unclassified Mesorhizobium]TGT61194.1 DUF1851 domain-containing protein [Mesorhizobium sp. M00.F.Ca.ET.170.01.1.1]AZO08961.1 DUF1851 domain-containing protein [Mesorhizobium sp. M3A.F.Ca.ET.080.04.2.1]PBB84173.1 hypothetical protein CK216_24085 [Mesorhizobium sp. WSM3876]RWB68189.1 MAG: DUF1851 domain-containing protein [Mesorhizobium sp.]RWB84568.1 MAG: DUF1851 domain-containing protein [Mesorhizobium sp.]
MTNIFSRFVSSIFGGKRDVEDKAGSSSTVKAALPGNLQHLFIEPSGRDVTEALDGWKWIGLDGLEPAAVSAFGDIFFRAADGSVKHLDMIAGRLTQVSRTWSELETQLNDSGRQDDLLLASLVVAARRKGLVLDRGQCYDFKKPPVLGGGMEVDQMEKTFFVVKVHIAGQIHRQVKDLPPGTKINKVTMSDH